MAVRAALAELRRTVGEQSVEVEHGQRRQAERRAHDLRRQLAGRRELAAAHAAHDLRLPGRMPRIMRSTYG